MVELIIRDLYNTVSDALKSLDIFMLVKSTGNFKEKNSVNLLLSEFREAFEMLGFLFHGVECPLLSWIYRSLPSHKTWTQMQNIGQQIPLYLVVFHKTDDWWRHQKSIHLRSEGYCSCEHLCELHFWAHHDLNRHWWN